MEKESIYYINSSANLFLELGDEYMSSGNLEQAMICNNIAASILCLQNQYLSSYRIESNLQLIAKKLPVPINSEPITTNQQKLKNFLHVLDAAYPSGGHTAMAIGWIKYDRANVHNVVLISQKTPIPHRLRQVVRETGGEIYVLDPALSPLQQAVWLRELAHKIASHVVLHINLNDVISVVAFGTPGGPPVLLVNHAAHKFWIGGSIADLVINCRGSQCEEFWTQTYRGINRFSTIPIPLLKPIESRSIDLSDDTKRKQAREWIGIPQDAIIVLTVGENYKYSPIDQLNFIEVAESILNENKNAFIIAVGVNEDSRWKMAYNKLESRLRAYGPQSYVAVFHQAADLYIEGFPFGSTTALLEAAIRGIPVVLAPAQCPPPYGSDGISLDDLLDRPLSIEEYKNAITFLISDVKARQQLGEKISSNIIKHHTGPGWRQYLESALHKLPVEHSVYSPITAAQTPEELQEYWLRFNKATGNLPERSLDGSIALALSKGICPRLSISAVRACFEARNIRIGQAIPLPILFILCNIIFKFISASLANRIYRKFFYYFRPEGILQKNLARYLPRYLW
jgi:glycosyltransferase involved in cell wall biosynthesis